MHGDAISFAPSSICDEQWHEPERPLLLPCVQEESTKQRFVVIASVFDTDTYDNERSRAMEPLRLAHGANTADALSGVFMCIVRHYGREKPSQLSQILLRCLNPAYRSTVLPWQLQPFSRASITLKECNKSILSICRLSGCICSISCHFYHPLKKHKFHSSCFLLQYICLTCSRRIGWLKHLFLRASALHSSLLLMGALSVQYFVKLMFSLTWRFAAFAELLFSVVLWR